MYHHQPVNPSCLHCFEDRSIALDQHSDAVNKTLYVIFDVGLSLFLFLLCFEFCPFDEWQSLSSRAGLNIFAIQGPACCAPQGLFET